MPKRDIVAAPRSHRTMDRLVESSGKLGLRHRGRQPAAVLRAVEHETPEQLKVSFIDDQSGRR